MSEIGKVSKISSKLEWEIEDFLSYNDDSYHESPDFQALDFLWCIRLVPKNKSKDKEEYISLYLIRYTEEPPVDCEFTLGIKSQNNTNNYEKKESARFGLKSEVFGWYHFIKRSELLERISDLVPSGNLTITCSLKVKSTTLDFNSSHGKLAKDLEVLFTSNESTDVTLYIKGKRSLAHRIILATRSPVFADMFKNNTEEKKTGIVNIVDSDPEEFHEFLFYLYTGEVDFSKCNVYDLYRISGNYRVPELKSMCVDFMIKNLCVENFFEILSLCHQSGEIGLVANLQRFFIENFKYIVSSTSWELLLKTNYLLANTLLKAMAEKL